VGISEELKQQHRKRENSDGVKGEGSRGAWKRGGGRLITSKTKKKKKNQKKKVARIICRTRQYSGIAWWGGDGKKQYRRKVGDRVGSFEKRVRGSTMEDGFSFKGRYSPTNTDKMVKKGNVY